MSGPQQQPLTGFSGGLGPLEPGGVCCSGLPEQTKRLSGQSVSPARRTHQVRINLPNYHGEIWESYKPKLRKKLAPVVFGAAIVGIDLGQLVAAATSLHLIAVTLRQLLMFANLRGEALDVPRINALIERIETLTGDRS